MKKHWKLYKRLIAFVLAAVLLVNGIPSSSNKVHASAIVGELSAEALSEIMYLRLKALESQLIAGGMKDGFQSVDDGLSLLDSYSKYEASIYSQADEASKELINSSSSLFTYNFNDTIYKVKTLPTVWKITNTQTNQTYDYNPYTNDFSVDNSLKTYVENKLNQAATNTAYVAMTGVSLLNSLYRSLSGFAISSFDTDSTDKTIMLGFDSGKYDLSEYYDSGFNIYMTWTDPQGRPNMLDGSVDNIIVTQSDLVRYGMCIYQTFSTYISYEGVRYDIVNDKFTNFSIPFLRFENNRWVRLSSGNGFTTHVDNLSSVVCNLPYFDSREDLKAWALGTTDYVNSSALQHKVLVHGAAEKLTDAFDDSKVYTPSSVDNVNTRLKNTAVAIPLGGTSKENTEEYDRAITNSISQSIAADITAEPSGDDNDEEYSGIAGLFHWLTDNILAAILAAITMVAGQIWEFFSSPITAIKDALLGIGSAVLGIPGTIIDIKDAILDFPWEDIKSGIKDLVNGVPIVDDIATKLTAVKDYLADILLNLSLTAEGDFFDDGNGGASKRFSLITFFNGFYLLLMILLVLLRLFIHCLLFIFNIFRIPASTRFLPDDVLLGFNYLKELEIPGIGMSVFGLFIGLVYVIIFFAIIGVLRVYISRMRVPHN